ncbi:MAG: hypothetical protein LBC90_00020 [Candidatus Adiutrix sp.]|jgi:hypothetical protein|nr:hypothetical protein [Candidatus Adiutrix sp.]
MNCYNHPERDAVAQCRECSKGLCRECADILPPPPICLTCAGAYAHTAIRAITGLQIRCVFLLIWGVFWTLFGIYVAFTKAADTGYNLDFYYNICFFLGFGGFMWIIVGHYSKSKKDRDIANIQSDLSMLAWTGGSGGARLMATFVQLIFVFALAAVMTPFLIIRTAFTLKKVSKEKARLKEFLAA